MLSHESSSNHLLKPLAFQLLLSTLLPQVTILLDWRKRPPIVCRFQDSLMLEKDLWLFHDLSALQNMVLWNYLCICITLHDSLFYALSMLIHRTYYSNLSYWEQPQKIVPLQEVTLCHRTTLSVFHYLVYREDLARLLHLWNLLWPFCSSYVHISLFIENYCLDFSSWSFCLWLVMFNHLLLAKSWAITYNWLPEPLTAKIKD